MSIDPLQNPLKSEVLAATAEIAGGPTPTTTDDPKNLRPVKTAEVVVYGKKACRTCYGAGLFFVLAPDGSSKAPKTCGCAISNFVRKNAPNLTYHQEEGSWYWNS